MVGSGSAGSGYTVSAPDPYVLVYEMYSKSNATASIAGLTIFVTSRLISIFFKSVYIHRSCKDQLIAATWAITHYTDLQS